jgi:diadenosine tetraphosphate (Ap4A) HIT family hydrolase
LAEHPHVLPVLFARDTHRVAATNAQCIALRDGFPVYLGHTLVIPCRHVASLADLIPQEQSVLWLVVNLP